ncbi:MAG: nicotinamide riboside transporter PnuC [Pseudomonadota bacterium]
MTEFIQLVIAQWHQQSLAEVFAVLFAIAYVWMAAEQKIWCWPAALVSTTLFTYVFWDVSLLFQMLLNAYYAAMAIVGWMSWRKTGHLTVARVRTMTMLQHTFVIGLSAVLTTLIVLFASHWLSYEMLWLDAGITMTSLVVTWLTVRKYLASWIYWTMINGASIVLFVSVDLYFLVCLMLIYIVLAMRGFIQWQKDARKYVDKEVGDIAEA